MKDHVVRHNEQPLLGTSKKVRKYKERADAVENNVNAVLKFAAENNLSYGQAIAKLKEGKL